MKLCSNHSSTEDTVEHAICFFLPEMVQQQIVLENLTDINYHIKVY